MWPSKESPKSEMNSNDNNKPTKYSHNSAKHTDIDTQKHQKPFRPKEEKINQQQH